MHKEFTLIEVKTNHSIMEFLNFPSTIYKNDKNWIRPLDEDIEKVFDSKKNKFFHQKRDVAFTILLE
jgi:4-alpha-glucanotransferase